MLYRITDGTVSAGGQRIFSHIHFEIREKEKIAIVGRNGAGKTTLLRLIAGELELDRDDRRTQPGIHKSREITVGMLRQSNIADQNKTVEEILLEHCPEKDYFSKERFLYETEYDRLFTGFGFSLEEKERRFSSFSGGEQTKISLIRLLLMKPDILLLDEPTNHLDIRTVEWLEAYMREYEKAVIFVSHDRFFLDQVVDIVYELQDGELTRYPGNYTQYRQQKQRRVEQQRKRYENQQAEIKRLNDLVEQFKHKPKKAAFARSRRTMLERMERIEKPREEEDHIFTGTIEPKEPGSKWVLEAEHLKLGYDKVLAELSLRVRRGQKIGIIGENGVGKSTFLKTAAGYLPPLGGKCVLGNRTMAGYFDQQSASIQSEQSVAEHFRAMFPGMTEKELRQTLGNYLFRGEEVSKRVSSLSGGEKARLVLAEVLCAGPNLLLLDEPTNHMDIRAKETLESAFLAYTGTILFVSHDRYFINRVADAILVFEGQNVYYYPFGYAHYLEKSRRTPGENLSALLRAEDQALIAGLRAVPKRERHETRQLSTQEAYLDWRLGLAAEPMREAQTRVEKLWERRDTACSPEEWEQVTSRLEEAWAEWTRQCLEWYRIMTEEGEERE